MLLLTEDVGRVRRLTFNRPDALNAFNTDLYLEAAAGLDAASIDPKIAVVILTGSGRSYSSGQDLGEMGRIDRPGAPTPSSTSEPRPNGFNTFMDSISRFPKPLIAAVNGLAVGIGMTMLAYCDIVLVSEAAKLRAPFPRLGVVPEAGSSYTFPVIMGWQNAAEILFTGDWVSPDEAVRVGLASRKVAADALLDAANEIAQRIAAMPISSLVGTKELMNAARIDQADAARDRESSMFSALIGGPANREAITAFMEKREPDFTNLSED